MIDRNKLKRIQGVLSARLGAEIPKFENPGGSLLKLIKGVNKFTQEGGKFFVNGLEVTEQDYNTLKLEYDKLIELELKSQLGEDLYNDLSSGLDSAKDALNAKKSTIQTEIPGAPEITPTTPQENAKELADKVEMLKEQTVAELKGNSDPLVKATAESIPEMSKSLSPNDGPKIPIPLPAAIPEKLEVPAAILEELKSAGMKFIEDKEKTEKKQEILGKVGNTLGQVATQGLNMAGAYFGAQQAATDSNLTKGVDAAYDTIAEGVKKLGPVGQVVGTAMGFAGTAGDIIQGLGGGTDQMTTTDKWMDSSFFSWNIGMINGFGGKRADTFAADKDILEDVGSSYGGTTEDIYNAAAKSGKKYGMFSNSARKKANRQMAAARTKQNLMGDISEEATDLRLHVQSMGELAGLAYALMTDGGYSLKYTYAAKLGGLLEWNPTIELEWQPQIELNWELPAFKEGGLINEELEWVPEFKDGGKTESLDIPEIEETTLKNVIPEGALHKNKHHMEHAEGLTKKGIPVIDEDGEQQAEIEHSEIIFTLEVTKKLEEYYDLFYSKDTTTKEKDKIALDVGKLLVYLILENTEDRTGLIESCKKGGTINLKKSTDDLIEEVLEWMPNVIVVEEVLTEVKEEKSKKTSEKELMKEAIKEVLIELLTK